MGLVALSIAVLLAAPVVAAVLGRRPALAALLDSFVLVTVGGIVALHVVPQSAELAGPGALVAAAVGLFVPILLHRVDATLAGRPARGAVDVVLLGVLLVAIFVHGLFDGTALTSAGQGELAVGVLLHRVPVGLALWVVVRPKLGVVRTLLVLVALIGGTIAGAAFGDAVATHASAPALALLQAFVAGSILHIVAESPPFATSTSPTARALGVVGALLAGLALWGLHLAHGEEAHGHDGASFVSWALAVAPAVALSFVVVGLLTAVYPAGTPPLRGRGARFVDALTGAGAGLPHPLCPCSVGPLYSDLVDKGASPAGARAFLVAAPELGVPAVLLSARLLGLPFTAARVVGAGVLALIAGLTAHAERANGTTAPPDPLRDRLQRGLRHGVVDAVDHVGPWILLGLAASTLLSPALPAGALAHVAAPVQVAVAALVALPLYLCPAGATPVAALLLSAGAAPGAVLAFLLVGPSTSAPTFALLKRRHGARAALLFALAVVGGAVAVGLLTNVLVGDALVAAVPHLDPHVEEGASSPWAIACAVGVAALLVASLYRQGVRGFLLQIMTPQHEHAGDHDHGPGCGHDHGPPIAPATKTPVARVRLDFDPRR